MSKSNDLCIIIFFYIKNKKSSKRGFTPKGSHGLNQEKGGGGERVSITNIQDLTSYGDKTVAGNS